MNISSTNLPLIYRQSLVRHPVVSLVRLFVRPWPYRVAPAAGESFGAHICPMPWYLCHLMPSHVHPYPHGPPANVPTLPEPINCTYSRSKWAVRSGWTRITVWTLLPLQTFSGRVGTLGIQSILMTNQQYFSVKIILFHSKRSKRFSGR